LYFSTSSPASSPSYTIIFSINTHHSPLPSPSHLFIIHHFFPSPSKSPSPRLALPPPKPANRRPTLLLVPGWELKQFRATLALPNMPALPNKTSRKRGVTPITSFHREDVWLRTLDMMGMEPLQAPASAPTSAILPSLESPTTTDTKKKLSILDLPQETQKDIFKHVSAGCSGLVAHF
jgi:hypothetical protein